MLPNMRVTSISTQRVSSADMRHGQNVHRCVHHGPLRDLYPDSVRDFLSSCGLCYILVDIGYINISVGSATTSSSSISSAPSSIDLQELLGDVSTSPIWSK